MGPILVGPKVFEIHSTCRNDDITWLTISILLKKKKWIHVIEELSNINNRGDEMPLSNFSVDRLRNWNILIIIYHLKKRNLVIIFGEAIS